MTVRRKHRADLGIVELAVDPADVDRDTYPVRIRLTRPLTPYEVDSLAASEPDLRCEGDALVLPAARLDDVARDIALWHLRLEQAQSRADEREGEVLVADHRRVEAQNRHGSHLLSQQTDDRGLH
jgi:hypothetical protein